MHALSPQMRACVDACLNCYVACLSGFSGHCLVVGGAHVAADHARLMLACAEMCRTSAHLMLLGTPHHQRTCAECAEICAQCAEDCERLEGMQDCAEACRKCAESCRAIAG